MLEAKWEVGKRIFLMWWLSTFVQSWDWVDPDKLLFADNDALAAHDENLLQNFISHHAYAYVYEDVGSFVDNLSAW